MLLWDGSEGGWCEPGGAHNVALGLGPYGCGHNYTMPV